MELLIVIISIISIYISINSLPIEQMALDPTPKDVFFIVLILIVLLFVMYKIVSEILEIRRECRKYK